MQDTTQVIDRKVFLVATLLVSLIFWGQTAAAVSVGWSVVVDDLDPEYSETGNAWASYTYPDAINGRYRYLSHKEQNLSRKGTATWQANMPTSGIYRVDIHYRPTDNRSPDADFLVYDGRGAVHHYSVDQTFHGPLTSTGWFTLGKFAWSAAQTAKVVLDGTDDEYSDEADAVRWTLVEATKGAAHSVPIAIMQGLLLTTVNLAGNWRETGGWAGCSTPLTSLATTILYSSGRYTFVKNGIVQSPPPYCSPVVVYRYWKPVSPTSQLVSKSVFTAMMEEFFANASGIKVLTFSQNKITYNIYLAGGMQTRTLTRQ